MVIGIIGGGASGMAAALEAAKNGDNRVVILERQARVGRKLLATGNGRCNLTNLDRDLRRHYHGEQKQFTDAALHRFNVEDTLRWFESLGLYTTAQDDGRVYPWSDQANSVVDVLRFALQRPNIQVLTGFEVTKVKITAGGFAVESQDECICCDKLIVACGGLAGTKLGGSLSGYKLLQKLGHHCTPLRPALVQLKSDWPQCASLKGVRAQCHVSICRDEELFAANQGELQFTEHGLSGPVIFDISRDVCREKGKWVAYLDLLPDFEDPWGRLLPMLQGKRQTDLAAEELFTGILHNRLGRVVVKEAGISLHAPIRQLEDWELEKAYHTARQLPIPLTEPMGMDSAQVTAGGIVTAEFDENTMESRLVPGLYACGEVLDIDGDCGGYNLQWAWSSGRLAGESAGIV